MKTEREEWLDAVMGNYPMTKKEWALFKKHHREADKQTKNNPDYVRKNWYRTKEDERKYHR